MRLFILALSCPFFLGCQSVPNPNQSKAKPETNPKLTKPVVRRVWIPEKIEDDGHVMIEGHWRFEIQAGSSWSR